jgi:large subunit ribosomal protein L22
MAKKEEKKDKDSNKETVKAEAVKVEKDGKKIIERFVVRARFLRIAPRKIRLLAGLIKGLPLIQAEIQLTFNPKRTSQFLAKVLKEAIATGEHNYNLAKEDLFIRNIIVNEGPTIHRFKPAAHGMAHPIQKRSTHLEMILEKIKEKPEAKKTGKGVLDKLGFNKKNKKVKK